MAIESNQTPDDLLRSYAHKRRNQVGPAWELNPRAREQLQAEVTRLHRARSAEVPPWFAWLSHYWPHLAIGAAAAAISLAVGNFWWRAGRATDLALADAEAQKLQQFSEAFQPPSAPVVKDPGSLAERMQRFQLGVRPALRSQTQTAMESRALPSPAQLASNAPRFGLELGLAQSSAPTSTRTLVQVPLLVNGPRQAGAAPAKRPELAQNMAAAPSFAAASARSAVPTAPPSAPNAVVGAVWSAPNLLRFQQINPAQRYRRNLNSPPTPPVLTQFDVTVEGNQIRVQDADGSIYLGNVQPTPGATAGAGLQGGSGGGLGGGASALVQLREEPGTMKARTAARFGRPAESSLANSPAAPSNLSRAMADKSEKELLARRDLPQSASNTSNQLLYFRASGTNRTLGREVVFTGEFEPSQMTQSQSALNQVVANQAVQNQALPAISNQQQFGNAGLGNASLGRAAPSNSLSGRLVGQASIGGKDELRIEALQVAP